MDSAEVELARAVEVASHGNAQAARRVVELVTPKVVRYCRARVGVVERANLSPEDVVQEVLIAVVRALPTYTERGRPFMAFVYGIASHKVADAHRAAGRVKSDSWESPPEDISIEDDPESMFLVDEGSAVMQDMLNALPAKSREIVMLRVLAGMTADETAEAVGSTPGAVRVAQHRAMKQLKDMMEKAGEGVGGRTQRHKQFRSR